MRTDHAVTRPNSESARMRPIVDRQTPVKTLSSLAVGKKYVHWNIDQIKLTVVIIVYSKPLVSHWNNLKAESGWIPKARINTWYTT